MSHQNSGNPASLTTYRLQTDAHHNKPEEHQEEREPKTSEKD